MLSLNEEQFKKLYNNLNIAQKEAVDTTLGPVLVVAGPGTGKTELLSLRVANILRQGEISPHNILCLTFTENGALNMRERLAKILRQDAYRVGIYTFHAFCNSIIARYPEYFYNAATYTQATDLERASIIEGIFASLPHKHPLASYHPEEGFVYMRDTLDRIKHIKSGGYTAKEYEKLIGVFLKEFTAVDKILNKWPEGRMTIKRLPEVVIILEEFKKLDSATATYLTKTLTLAISGADILGKMEPVADWKKKYTVTVDEKIVSKDSFNKEKITAVADVYKEYSKTLTMRGLYDYDDMIIDVAHALAENSVLRNELEEQYQYILIDEFQDTNDAQMNLVRAITSSYVHEDRPNVMVVGDDDQAIYKFQGAEISNIVNFRNRTYKEVKTIVLDTNYRSHQSVLDFSRTVVLQGENRLETRFVDIKKLLTQGNQSVNEGNIHIERYRSDIEEYATVAKKVADAIVSGVNPVDIAILARNHRELRALLPYLDQEAVPYEYIKKANVFDEPHVRELITICDYATSVASSGERKDYLLPAILSYPYFNIARTTLFQIAVEAKEKHTSWAEVISTHKDGNVVKAYELLADVASHAHTMPLEHLLHHYIDNSGFKEHYFDKVKMKEHPATYVSFLASLKTFIEGMREWRSGEELLARDVEPYVAMHKEHDIPLVSESPFMKAEHAVQIMSAHAAKGLEFGTVFIIATHDELWTKSPRANKSPLPSALTPLLSPAGDNEDDFIRLFYVALTRAKHTLHISGHKPLIRYLHNEQNESFEAEVPRLDLSAHENALAIVATPFQEDEWALLKRLIKNYRMPVTHLSNFLNITDGGPLYFVEQNLLRFPQPMNVAAVFGSAMHKAIGEIVMYPKFHGGDPADFKHILAIMKRDLARGRLPAVDYKKQSKRGEDVLKAYYKARKEFFLPDDAIEVDMKEEGVTVGEALLTGKLDFLRLEVSGKEKSYQVLDFKTGRAYKDWDQPKLTDVDKIKLHKYKQQLIYYKILLESSSRFNYPVGILALEFVESILDEKEPITLIYEPTAEDVERLKKIIEAVYHKIITLNFPDISKYDKSHKGILQFEDDLIKQHSALQLT